MKKLFLLLLFSSVIYGERITFLPFEDMTIDGKGKERLATLISSILPQQGFSLVGQDRVERVLPLSTQKEIGSFTPEIAQTLGELFSADILVKGKVSEPKKGTLIIACSFLNARRELDPILAERILSLFWSELGRSYKIEKVISADEMIISGEFKIGDKLEIIKAGKKIGYAEVIKAKDGRAELLYSCSENFSTFDSVRRSAVSISDGKIACLITSSPEANISLDRNFIGKTPIIINKAKKGLLSISQEGYLPFQMEIIPPDTDSFLDLLLVFSTLSKKEEKKGSILVVTNPQNAKVYLDGELIGLTPFSLSNIPARLVDVRIEKDGFLTLSEKVLVEGDVELRRDLTSAILPKPIFLPAKEKENHPEVISIPTAHTLNQGEAIISLNYPNLFVLRAGLPTGDLKTELRIEGLGAGLKYGLNKWVSASFSYSKYNMREKEKEERKQALISLSLPIEEKAMLHLGGGYLWALENKERWFLGVEIPIKENIALLIENDNIEKYGLGFRLTFGRMGFLLGVGKDRFDGSIFLKRKPPVTT
ncbi:MAG: PEGA domain-containing protein [bacterium]|nr:PEGA domain-containing protein [bacterium]